jgi:hypothetical protein
MISTYLVFNAIGANIALPIVLIAFVTGDCGEAVLGCETPGPGQT